MRLTPSWPCWCSTTWRFLSGRLPTRS
jgi:hypothetical protein